VLLDTGLPVDSRQGWGKLQTSITSEFSLVELAGEKDEVVKMPQAISEAVEAVLWGSCNVLGNAH